MVIKQDHIQKKMDVNRDKETSSDTLHFHPQTTFTFRTESHENFTPHNQKPPVEQPTPTELCFIITEWVIILN